MTRTPDRDTYRTIRRDVFLHTTLGGFDPVPADRGAHPRYHSAKMISQIEALIRKHDRIPHGVLSLLAERFDRSPNNSLRVTAHNLRREIRRADRGAQSNDQGASRIARR